MVAPREKGKDVIAKATTARPSAPFFPTPEPKKAPAPAPAPESRPSAPQGPPEPHIQGSDTSIPGPTHHPEPQQPAPGSPASGSPSNPSHRIVGPTMDDLMRYAKIDKETEMAKDEETITLDTDDLMYTSYLQALKRRIEMIWKYPETARRDGLQGNLVMRFSISKSGRVENIDIIKSSGYPELDEAARQALIDANPFNPLPDNWKKDYFTITGTFVYRLYGMYVR